MQPTSQLDQLKQFTKVVADTGDFATLKQYAPLDATTNPSLILKAALMPEYKRLVEKAVADNRNANVPRSALAGHIVDHLLVLFGIEILKIVPGRVSTETDANLSFDAAALVEKGRKFIALYEKNGIARERILIKIATTCEGTRACEVLQKKGTNCNMTLLFSLAQAVACAQVNAKLISPFVGRILDWHKKSAGKEFVPAEDPGVLSVRAIYNYYKRHGHNTEVMGANFRNVGEIQELAGCDLLTISPALLAELQKNASPLPRKLSPDTAAASDMVVLEIDEEKFCWQFNEDVLTIQELSYGLKAQTSKSDKLIRYVEQMIEERPTSSVFSQPKSSELTSYDTFISYHSKDSQQVAMVANALKRRGISVWFDQWDLLPGRQFAEEIEKVIPKSKSMCIFYGKSGIGPWEKKEVAHAIRLFKHNERPLIPVLLPGVSCEPDLPLLLEGYSWLRISPNGLKILKEVDDLVRAIRADLVTVC